MEAAQEAMMKATNEMKYASAKFQQGLVERFQLKARIDDCLMRMCDPKK